MDALETFGGAVILVAAVWVGWCSVWRLNLMRWGRHQCLQLAAYICIAMWSATWILGLGEFRAIGIIGVALLFLGGRERWLTKAPTDTERG